MERKEMEEEKKVMEGMGGVIMHITMEEEVEKVMEGKGGIIDRTKEEEVEEVEEEEEEEIQEEGEEEEEIQEEEEEEEIQEKEKVMEGIASIALLPCGSISGHFIQLPGSVCYGLQGAELACERECSRGEDYRLIKLTIMDYSRKRERVVVVECRGHDAARFQNVDQAHGWEKDVVGMVEKKHAEHKISVSFECETLKADKAAEDHIKQFMPNVSGLDAVVNVGRMCIAELDFEAEDKLEETQD